MIETDVNGLCSECAPYFYLSLEEDVKELEKILEALSRINNPLAAAGRIEKARNCLQRLTPYVKANLAVLPYSLPEIEDFLQNIQKRIEDDLQGETQF